MPHSSFFHRVQTQVSKVIGVMKDNISKVMERGEKLDDLEEKSGQWWYHWGQEGGGVRACNTWNCNARNVVCRPGTSDTLI